MANHDHILSRIYESDGSHKRIEKALNELKQAAGDLSLQQAIDIGSAIMDIEAALAAKE